MTLRPHKALQWTAVLLFLLSCKKVEVPNDKTSAILGEWTYVNSIGGVFANGPIWPTDKSIWIEFKENGRYKKHERGKLIKSEKFTFVQSNNNPNEFIIEYESDQPKYQAFLITGDTLQLWDYYVADGCFYTFVRR